MKNLITLIPVILILSGCFQKSSQVNKGISETPNPIPTTKTEQPNKTEPQPIVQPPEQKQDKDELYDIQEVEAEQLSQEPVRSGRRGKSRGRRHMPKMKLAKRSAAGGPSFVSSSVYDADMSRVQPRYNTEEYDRIYENGFREAKRNPLSTFSIDVDAASYANVRRFINSNTLPPKDAVRIEELINYFSYDYPQPANSHPFSIITEMSECPWNSKHKLVHIGLQGKEVPVKNLPASNLVFLLDVSGSMNSPNKLGLLKKAFKLLTGQMRSQDKISIVVYAGAAGMVLPPTDGSKKSLINNALENLRAGGSTAGGAGINLAYKTAMDNFISGGNNRVILATDGDFNVGASSDGDLVRMIEEKRASGIYLTILGFGMGNYKDSKMEKLADKGNGNYAYIDNLMEAKKVLVSEIGGTLFTIAKDVKIQVEFNPNKVNAYRLIGYENRMLKSEDFNNDKKDAGELGSGHTVTALYEVIPAGVKADLPAIEALKYQKASDRGSKYAHEMMTVKFRYKPPRASASKLMVKTLREKNTRLSNASDNFKFAAAVAGFGMLLRESKHKNNLRYHDIIAMAKSAKGKDANGYRAEFIRMTEMAQLLNEGKRL